MGDAIVAIDIGGTYVRVLGSDQGREQIFVYKFSNTVSPEQEIRDVFAFFERTARHLNFTCPSVGVAAAPGLDGCGTITRWPNRPHWLGVPLGVMLQRQFAGTMTIEDDCNAAALAEAVAEKIPSLFYIGLGTGVGGGFVVDGRIYRGANGLAAEVGHLPLALLDGRCSCGQTRCVQAISSGRAFFARASRLRGSQVTEVELRQGVSRREAWAVKPLVEAAETLCHALSFIQMLLDPGVIVLGGGFAAAYPELLGLIQAAMISEGRGTLQSFSIKASSLGVNSSLTGAKLLAQNINPSR